MRVSKAESLVTSELCQQCCADYIATFLTEYQNHILLTVSYAKILERDIYDIYMLHVKLIMSESFT